MKYIVASRKVQNAGGTPVSWTDHDVTELKREIEPLIGDSGFEIRSVRNQTVLLHPNLVRPHRNRPASFTDPRLILAVAEYLLDHGARAVEIGENPGFEYAARDAFREAGLAEPLKRRGVSIRYFDEEDWIDVDNPDARLYHRIRVSKAVLDADVFVNIPKMKTHMLTGVSLSIKNLLGMIHDDDRQIFHRNDIADKVVDLLFVRPPDLNIIDGLWAMEGQAPFHGDAVVSFNVLLAGMIAPVLDAVACRIMGFDPEEVPHVQLACHRHLDGWEGLDGVSIAGSDPGEITRRFKRPVLSSMAQFQGVECIECGVCSGCLSAVRHSLDWLSAEGLISRLDKVTIVSGRPMPNRQTLTRWDGELILFGNCAA
ncbi:MAG TPA: DUF362 domain-containing protein, partial [bacterium]|nr:DUF362 domain-containing protein [bacterium]